MGDLAGLDVPDEVEIAGAEGAVHLDDELVALGVLLADGEKPDTGRRDAVGALHDGGAHVRVLDEVGGAGVGGSADVEKNGGAQIAGGDDHAERRAGDAGYASKAEEGGGKGGAGVPAVTKASASPSLTSFMPTLMEASGFAFHGLDRVVHGDHVRGIDDTHVLRSLAKLRPHLRLTTDEEELDIKPPGSQQRTPDDFGRAVVAAHGVDRYPWSHLSGRSTATLRSALAPRLRRSTGRSTATLRSALAPRLRRSTGRSIATLRVERPVERRSRGASAERSVA